ncbi:MAG TPA: FimV/HubP family polar landmark protein [Telluria sp.]|nr:FimV/HubP family polar landmark protein [Telluria sp.]
MHVNRRSRFVSFALKAMTAAVASAVMVSAAHAAGLGKLTVLSSLGQPLRAEIELTAVSADEAQELVARLASTDAFRLANIEFNPALLSLHFEIEQRGGRQILKVTSTKPLNEPFVDMLLELQWSKGRIVREYTFLLDPAELRTTQSAQVTPVEVKRLPAQNAPAAEPARQAKAPAAAPPAARGAASEYKVKRGDSLSKIAAEVKPADVSLDMMLVALYRANPDAFFGNNMNRLKSGVILAVPDDATIKGTGEGEARSTVIAHAADFNAYRNKLAGQVAAAEPQHTQEPAQSVAGKITARVEEQATPARDAKDQLKLSRANPSAKAAAGKTMVPAAEDRFAKEQELADATARVKELEKNVNDLEKLLAVKGKAGANAAKQATPSAPPAASASQPASVPAPAASKPPVKKPPRSVAPPAPSIMDMVMENLYAVGGGLLALLLGAFAIVQRKRKKDEPEAASQPTEPSILGAPSEQATSLFADTGGASVDTTNSVFNSSFAPSASQLDTNEVDPVAEADVYIAYGRDAQAEEILKEALRVHPERMPVRLKLLEIYAARKDQRAFETQASEIYSMTKGVGDEWAQAAALGLTIDPLNPLYAGAAAPSMAPSVEEQHQQAILAQELDDALSGEAPAMPAPEPEATAVPEPAAAPQEEDHTLDFDLGGLSFKPTQPGAAPAPALAEAAPAAEALPDMSFDLDTATPAAAPAPAAPAPAAEAALDDMSFDLSFDTPAAPAATPLEQEMAQAEAEAAVENKLEDMNFDFPPQAAPAGAPAPAAQNDFNMADLAKEFELPSLPEAAGAAEPPPAEVPDSLLDLDAMSFELPGAAATPAPSAAPAPAETDFSLDLPELAAAPAPAAAEPAGFDLSGIDLDLPAAGAEETALPDLAAAETMVQEVGELTPEQMEMETKLDLAVAYQEIGDKEGARELIEEVVKGGSPQQVAKANELLAQLG